MEGLLSLPVELLESIIDHLDSVKDFISFATCSVWTLPLRSSLTKFARRLVEKRLARFREECSKFSTGFRKKASYADCACGPGVVHYILYGKINPTHGIYFGIASEYACYDWKLSIPSDLGQRREFALADDWVVVTDIESRLQMLDWDMLEPLFRREIRPTLFSIEYLLMGFSYE